MSDEKEPIDLNYAPPSGDSISIFRRFGIVQLATVLGAISLVYVFSASRLVIVVYTKCERLPLKFSIFEFVLGILSVVAGIVAFCHSKKESIDKRIRFILFAGSLAGLTLVYLTIRPIVLEAIDQPQGPFELARRTVCSANLRGIAQAADAYRLEHGTDYAWLDNLVAEGSLTPKQLRCPSFDSNPNCYRRVKQCPPNKDGLVPIIIEDPRNHYCEGGNVLYDDGSVDFLRKPALDALIQSATFE